MNYTYLLLSIGMSIMTNQAYYGFNVAQLAEQAVNCSKYIAQSWTSSNLEGKIALSGSVGVVSWCSYLLYQRCTLAPVDPMQQKIAMLRDERDLLLRISWKLTNIIQDIRKNRVCEG